MKITVDKLTKEMMECVDGDGHSICKETFFTDAGWPQEYIDQISYVHESDGSAKGTIFGNDGEILEELKGVACLNFHWKVANDLGCKPSDKMGRGFQAQQLSGRIWEKYNEHNKKDTK